MAPKGFPVMTEPELVEAKDRAAWRRWLQRNHSSLSRVWLVIRKKGSRAQGVSYEEAVEEALCFGWIDGKLNRLDAEHYKLWFAPRKPRSVWSAINKRRVAELIRSGRMTEAGLVVIDVAKKDGSWTALEAVDSLVVPPDLAKALKAYPAAKRHLEAFPQSSRKVILYWIQSAKRPETRAKRIEETVRLAADNIRPGQWWR